MGNRIAKHIYDASSDLDPVNWNLKKTVYYVRDATGNVMSTYEKEVDDFAQAITYDVIERPIYGSSRVGLYTSSVNMLSTPQYEKTNHFVGARNYELSNHLGNVLTVISDQKLSIDTDGDNTIDYSLPIAKNANDYYAFGSGMRERSFELWTGGPNIFTPTIEDAVGITISGDEITNTSAVGGHGNSAGASKEFIYGNGSVQASVGSVTDDSYQVWFGLSDANSGNNHTSLDYAIALMGNGRIYIWHGASTFEGIFTHSYSLSSVLKIERKDGMVHFSIDDVVVKSYPETPAIAGVPLLADFSMAYIGTKLHNLKLSGAGDAYRYGFNGKEKDDEVSGGGNVYDYGFRIYNPRLGRFLSVDPLTKSFPAYSPYQFSANMPIAAIDIDGLEAVITINSPWYLNEIKKAVDAGDVQRALYLANKSVLIDRPKDGEESTFIEDAYDGADKAGTFNHSENVPASEAFPEGLTVMDPNGNVLFNVKQTIMPDEEKGNVAEESSVFDPAIDFLVEIFGNWEGDTHRDGGIMFTSSDGQGQGTVIGGKDAEGPINIDDLLGAMGATKGAASGGPAKNILEVIGQVVENVDNLNGLGAFDDKPLGGEPESEHICPTCGGQFSSSDTANHNTSLKRTSGPFTPAPAENKK